jgi:hypothetical protein
MTTRQQLGIVLVLVYVGAIVGWQLAVWIAPHGGPLDAFILCAFLMPAVLFAERCREGKLKAKHLLVYALVVVMVTLGQAVPKLANPRFWGRIARVVAPAEVFALFLIPLCYFFAVFIIRRIKR